MLNQFEIWKLYLNLFLLKFFEHVLDPHSKGKQQTCIWAFQVCVLSSVYALISGHFWNRAKRLEIWRITSQQHFWRFWTSNSNLPRVRSIQIVLNHANLCIFQISKHLAWSPSIWHESQTIWHRFSCQISSAQAKLWQMWPPQISKDAKSGRSCRLR